MDEASNDFLLFVMVVVIAIVLWIGGGLAFKNSNSSVGTNTASSSQSILTRLSSPSVSSDPQNSVNQNNTAENSNFSVWKGVVRLRASGARLSQANKEYVTLETTSNDKDQINVSGWTLQNSTHPSNEYDSSGQVVILPAVRVTIPQAVSVLWPNSQSRAKDIVLGPNQKVVVVTGAVPTTAYITIDQNFRTNICSGYLERLSYHFSPSLSTSCPANTSETGFSYLDEPCRKFIERMGTCHTPDFQVKISGNKTLDGYVDNTANLTSQCKNFLQKHFSYENCLNLHIADSNFYGSDWRVFLGRPWELWNNDHETITLYDQFGKIVDQVKY